MFEAFNEIDSQYKITFQELAEKLNQIINNAEENLDSEKETFRLWAYYGWTTIGLNSVGFYRSPPINQQKADAQSLSVFQRKNSFRNYIERDKIYYVNESDIEEALKAFEAQCYKSCALLLVSVIDGLLLNYQRDTGHEKINVGRGAVKFVEDISSLKDPFLLLIRWNTLYYLKYLFDYDGSHRNFVDEPDYINRNFLMHGMSQRDINKIDCIKLFVAIGNVSRLIKTFKSGHMERVVS